MRVLVAGAEWIWASTPSTHLVDTCTPKDSSCQRASMAAMGILLAAIPMADMHSNKDGFNAPPPMPSLTRWHVGAAVTL